MLANEISNLPSPLIHTAVAGAIAVITYREPSGCLSKGCEKGSQFFFLFLVVAFIANLPDLDFIPGLLFGNLLQFHHHLLSHSLGLSILLAFLVSHFGLPGLPCKKSYRFWTLLLVGCSHPLLDICVYDSLGRCTPDLCGIAVGWPVISKKYFAVIPLFEAANLGVDLSSWVNWHNARVVAKEFVFGLLVVLAAIRLRRTSSRLNSHH